MPPLAFEGNFVSMRSLQTQLHRLIDFDQLG